MQLNPVYLYSNKVDVFTNLDSWTTERYRKVYQRNFKVFRGVDNRLDLQVRNGDQKAKDITGYTLVFNLVERETQKLLINRDCSVSSAVNGKVYITLTERDLNDLSSGFYNYSIYAISESTGNTMPLYADTQFDAIGTLEVSGDIFGEPEDSLIIDTFELIPTYWPNDGTSNSELVYASPEVSSTGTVHTFAVYHTDYRGTINIEASLEDGGTPGNGDWTTVASIVDPQTPIQYINAQGRWNWFRIKHIPSVGEFIVNINRDNVYKVKLDNGGRGYSVNDQFTITGSRLGGFDSVHDLVITVTSVNNIGAIVSFTFTGVANYLNLPFEQIKTILLGTIDKVMYR